MFTIFYKSEITGKYYKTKSYNLEVDCLTLEKYGYIILAIWQDAVNLKDLAILN